MRKERILGLGALGVIALGSMGFSFGEPQLCLNLAIELFGVGGGESLCLPPS